MARAAVLGRLVWLLAEVVELVPETPRVTSLVLDVPGWAGHRPGQHVDVRLTAEGGYQAQRSYSIATPADAERLVLTVEELDDGEVSPFLTEELGAGDRFELRGPIGGHFVWDGSAGGPLHLVAGGSGVVPLMAMLRHRAAAGLDVPATLLYSSRTLEDVIYREELDALAGTDPALRVVHTAGGLGRLRAAHRRQDAGRGLRGRQGGQRVRLRLDALRRGGRGRPGGSRLRAGQHPHRAVRPERSMRWRLQT